MSEPNQAAAAVENMPFSRALSAGLRRALSENDRVLLMGEDIGKLGGVFRVTEGLQAEFGDARDQRRDVHARPPGHHDAGLVAQLDGQGRHRLDQHIEALVRLDLAEQHEGPARIARQRRGRRADRPTRRRSQAR